VTASIRPRVAPNPRPCVELLVIQPTPFCNMACRYCYLPVAARQERSRMADETLAAIGNRILRGGWAAPALSVVWHSGEPLTLAPAFYERAIALLGPAPNGVVVSHGLQTNGTLIDEAWVELFVRHRIGVGISLDGPQDLHDRNRVWRDGRGTFAQTMRGMALLRRHGVPFNVITVLTDESLARAEELFWFYVDNGISSVAFNIEEIEGGNAASSLANAEPTRRRFRDFLERLWDLSQAHPRLLSIREIDSAAGVLTDPAADGFGNPLTEPLRIVSVDVEGQMSTFSPELLGTAPERYGGFRFADIRTGGVEALLASPHFTRAQADIGRGVRACRDSCAFFRLCRGGAPANKLFEHGRFDVAETMFCALTKQTVLDVALRRLESSTMYRGNA
jgi:uncharacterized protein